MIIKKKADTYNTYTLEVSWGQLQAFLAALQSDHADPVRDETMAELSWYMDRVPGPGEDEEEIEAQQKAAQGGGAEGAVEGEDLPIPMPPGNPAGTAPEGTDEEPTFPPEDDEAGQPTPAAMKLGAKPPAHSPGGPGLPEPDFEGAPGGAAPAKKSADRRLPEPPNE